MTQSKRTKAFWMLLVVLCVLCVIMVIFSRKEKKPSFPIDVVYTWVDGNDPQWAVKKAYWQKKYGIYQPYAVSAARYRDREELKYSLRSVEENIPWVRTIFIVTDNQIPKWLNTSHPKIRIVDHKDIFPADALPVFNSSAIETRLPFIPGLAEHFIYFNDDMFVNKPLTPDFFFTKEGIPIYYSDIRVDKERKSFLSLPANAQNNVMYHKGEKILEDIYHIDLNAAPTYGDTHTMTPYRKTDFLENIALLGDLWTKTTYSKFRNTEDVSRGIFVLPDNLKGKNVIKDALGMPEKCGVAGKLIMNNIWDMEAEDPCTFCLNDTSSLSEEASNAQIEYLKKRFPKKSSFEL